MRRWPWCMSGCPSRNVWVGCAPIPARANAAVEMSAIRFPFATSSAMPPSTRTTSFACGDAVYGTHTVIEAVAAGRAAASEIDRALGGDGDISEVLAPVEIPDSFIGKVEGFGDLERKEECVRCAGDRCGDFCQVSAGISDNDICQEASRCLQCDLRFQITGHRIWSDYMEDEKEAAK